MALTCPEISADFLRVGKVVRRNMAEFTRENGLNCLDGIVRRNS
jgi:hypothetical protein